MPIPTPPAVYIRLKSLDIADNSGFSPEQTPSYNSSTHKWTLGVQQVHDNQLDGTATAIEKLFLQDFSQPIEFDRVNVDAAVDVDGVTVLNPEFEVVLHETADAPSGFDLGSTVNLTVGQAWAFRTMIRQNLGIGTPYTP